MQAQQNPNQPLQRPPRTELTTKEFSAKYESKREVYNFVAVDCGFYVPDYDQVTIYFLKDIMTGKKKCKCHHHSVMSRQPFPHLCLLLQVIKNKDVQHVAVPPYEGLTIEKIAQFVNNGHEEVY